MSTCRLRKYRKAANLTQREVATLVGYASQRAYSDVELGINRPALGTALACSILFDAPPHELFPGLAEFIERDVLARTRALHEVLGPDADREPAVSFLFGVLGRLVTK